MTEAKCHGKSVHFIRDHAAQSLRVPNKICGAASGGDKICPVTKDKVSHSRFCVLRVSGVGCMQPVGAPLHHNYFECLTNYVAVLPLHLALGRCISVLLHEIL